MANRPIPDATQIYHSIVKTLHELNDAYENIVDGNLAEISSFPETAFGPVAQDLRTDWAEMDFFVSQELYRASEAVLDTLEEAMKADALTGGLFEAVDRYTEKHGTEFPENADDKLRAKWRLTQLTLLFDAYQEEPTDGYTPNPVTQRQAFNRMSHNRGFLRELEEGTSYEDLRLDVLDVAAIKTMIAAQSFLHATRMGLATEMLRLEAKHDKSEPLVSDEDHLLALAAAKRGLERANILLHNAWYAMPEIDADYEPLMPVTGPDDDDDNDGGQSGSTPPAPKPTLH